MTPEEINKLATQVCLDRLGRGVVVGHTSKGRVITVQSEEGKTEAEKQWFALQADAAERTPTERGIHRCQ